LQALDESIIGCKVGGVIAQCGRSLIFTLSFLEMGFPSIVVESSRVVCAAGFPSVISNSAEKENKADLSILESKLTSDHPVPHFLLYISLSLIVFCTLNRLRWSYIQN